MKTNPSPEPNAQPAARILVVEDERPMRTALVDCLTAEGYRVLVAVDGEQGLAKAIAEKPDAILLDVMMPRMDGFSVAAELRRLGHSAPILMLTAKGTVQDRITGLDAGADDYLVKPFSMEELSARVRALIRRGRRAKNHPAIVRLGEVEVDFLKQSARRGKTELPLTQKEFACLRLLIECAGEVVTRERFLDLVWGFTAFPTTRTVDTHMASLRGKVEKDPAHPRFIHTVHGAGYRLDLDSDFAKR